MRMIQSLMHVSLDGFVAGPKGEMDWIRLDDDVFSYVDNFIKNVDTGFYGPQTFQMMESHWPGVLKNPAAAGHQLTHAKWYAEAEKIVFSRQVKTLENPQAKLINDNFSENISALKRKPGKNIMIFGSPGLVHSLAQIGLIDEFIMNINPIILGTGIPLFKDIENKIQLQLVNSTQFKCGVLGCYYKR